MPDSIMSRVDRGSFDSVLGKYTYISKSAAYTMKPSDHLVHVVPGGAYQVTLPPVVECTGGLYVIKGVGSGTSNVTVADQGDALVAVSIVIDAAAEVAVLYCDGEQWFTLLALNIS